VEHVACMWQINAYKVFVRKSKRKRPLRKPRRRREYNITMHLRENGCEGVNWINLAQDGDQ